MNSILKFYSCKPTLKTRFRCKNDNEIMMMMIMMMMMMTAKMMHDDDDE